MSNSTQFTGNPMDYMKLIGKLPLFHGSKNADVASEWLTTIKITVSLPETEEFSVESAPVESAPVVRLIYYNFHPYKFCGDIELVLEELVLTKLGSILIYNDLSNL
ncbi:hypothetical protein MFLAVUS_004839 [Mucor flavus]|uniref:Uncharacterized protein n=1 Tax=Mucor flavus TaxID=439312 RepID=A0ABP9YX11_9FUNG